MTIKGCLHVSLLPLGGFRSKSPKSGPNGGFREKEGLNFRFWFCDPENAHSCAEPHL